MLLIQIIFEWKVSMNQRSKDKTFFFLGIFADSWVVP